MALSALVLVNAVLASPAEGRVQAATPPAIPGGACTSEQGLSDLWSAWAWSKWSEDPSLFDRYAASTTNQNSNTHVLFEPHRDYLVARRHAESGRRREAEQLWETLGLPSFARVGFEGEGRIRWLRDRSLRGGLPVGRWLDLEGQREVTLLWGYAAAENSLVTFRVGAPRAWSLLVDGREYAHGDAGGFDAFAVTLHLSSGVHRVELRTSATPSNDIFLRASGGDGWGSGRWVSRIPDIDPGAVAPVSLDPIAMPQELFDADLVALTRCGSVLKASLGRRAEAARDLRELAPFDPWAAVWFVLLYPDPDWSLLQRAIDADFGAAWLGWARAAADRSQLLEAREAFERALEWDPTSPRLAVARARFGFDVLNEGMASLRFLETARPTAAVSNQRARILDALGDPRGAEQAALTALRLDATSLAARSLAVRLATRRGDVDAVRELLTEAMVVDPAEPRWRAEWHRVQPTGSEPSLQDSLSRWPDHEIFHEIAAERALQDGRNADFIQHLLVAAEPNSPSEGWLSSFRQGKARKSETLPPISSSERLAGAEVLWDRRQIDFDGQRLTRRVDVLMRSQSEEAGRRLRTHSLSYAPSRERLRVLSAERLRPGHASVPASRVEDETAPPTDGMYLDARTRRIEFDDLSPGDAIHIVYLVESWGPNMLGGFFGSIEPMQTKLPVREAVMEVTYRPEYPLYTQWVRLPAPVEDVTSDGRTRLKWSVRELESIPREPLGPAYADIGAFVTVSSYRTWSELSRWYDALTTPEARLDDATRAAGRAATRNVRGIRDTVDALFNLVTDRIRYVGIELGIHGWKPRRASSTFRQGYGDCKDQATLLRALLADHGIETHLVLVRTVDRGGFPKTGPSMWAFNHAILWIEALDLFVDPTVDHGSIDHLPPEDQGALAMIVRAEGPSRLIRLPLSDAETNKNTSEYEISWSSDGQVTLLGFERFQGSRALEIRRAFETPEERKVRLEHHLGTAFPGVQLDRLAHPAPRDRGQAEYTFEASVNGALRPPARLDLPISLFQHGLTARYAGLESRRTDLVLRIPWSTHNRISVHLPPRAEVGPLPAPVDIEGPGIRFRQQISATADGFEVEDVLTLERRRIPHAAYPAFRDTCRAVDNAMSRRVEIRWP